MKLKLTYLFLVIIAILCGFYLGNACLNTSEPALIWLGKSLSFNIGPATLGLNALTFIVELRVSINFLQILFIALAVAAAPKVAAAIK
ncbi:MAG: hypothetical protein IKX57_08450 [Oscillospiraceae bacterium]|nr:hypothetical protein [Oscillospiraceae bacterium]MBR5723649.1 hypothetical protein [Oscillospiraceae bacterium]